MAKPGHSGWNRLRSSMALTVSTALAYLPGPLSAARAEGAEGLNAGGIGLTGAMRAFFATLWAEIAPILAATGTIPSELGKAWAAIASEAGMMREAADTAITASLMLLAALVARRFASKLRQPGFDRDDLRAILASFAADTSGLLALVFVAIVGGELLLTHKTLAGFLGLSLIELLVRLEAARVIAEILYRPRRSSLRLMPGSDEQVARGRPWIAAAILLGLGFPALIPVFLRAGMDWSAAQALALMVGSLTATLGFLGAWLFLEAGGCARRLWKALAVLVAASFWLAWCYGVIRLDFPFFFAVAKLGAVGTVAMVVDRLCAVAARIPVPTAESGEPTTFRLGRTALATRRIAYVLAIAATTAALASWLAESNPSLLPTGRGVELAASVSEALVLLCAGYVAFEALMGWMDARFAPRALPAVPGLEDDDIPPATRLATVIPLLRGVVGAALLGISALIALSRIGLNITPVLAGAGILGLAVSFGSQSLIRDIVAGLFYMIDDAFRLGEFIEASRLKGNVERISLRSVRLRHQNGQIHTIPFGQLGSITNYSRDWVTMKFNLRLSRNVDVDQVRKTVKAIGHDLLADEEYGKEFLQPLKMQGIADILENALVMRFKFTVRPGKPTAVQREAVKRIVKIFGEQGIAFAQNSVVVERVDSGSDEGDAERRVAAAGQYGLSGARGVAV